MLDFSYQPLNTPPRRQFPKLISLLVTALHNNDVTLKEKIFLLMKTYLKRDAGLLQ